DMLGDLVVKSRLQPGEKLYGGVTVDDNARRKYPGAILYGPGDIQHNTPEVEANECIRLMRGFHNYVWYEEQKTTGNRSYEPPLEYWFFVSAGPMDFTQVMNGQVNCVVKALEPYINIKQIPLQHARYIHG